MKEATKKKLEGKSAYIALALLLTMIIVFTVIAIIASVNSQEEPLPDSPVDNTPVPDDSGDATTGGDDVTEPDDTETDVTPAPEATVYIAPCSGYVQKDYSADVLVFSNTMKDHRVHLGIDIVGSVGDPVKAFCKGIIDKIFNDAFMGKTIVVDHGNGLKSVYMNLADAIPDGIKVGEAVEAGTVIGAIGESAIRECADSPHLHFELHLNGNEVDPKNYVTLPSSSEADDVYEG